MISLTDVLGWGSLDVEFLNDRIEEFDLDINDIKEDMKGYAKNNEDINSWIYSAFRVAAYNFLDKLTDYDRNYDISKIDIEVFVNCLDSFYEGVFAEVDVMDWGNENFDKFIANN